MPCLQQLAHELTRGALISFGLEEHIQDRAFRVDGPPQGHQLTANADRHLVEVPSSMRLGASGPQPAGDLRAEDEDPAPDTLVGDHNAPLGQGFFNVSEAEREAQVHPDSTLYDVSGEAVTRVRMRGHAAQL